MPDVTIQNLRVAPGSTSRVPTTVKAFPVSDFLLNDADNTAISAQSPYNGGVPFKSVALSLESSFYYGAADFTLPSTTDSPDNPNGARWGLFVFDANDRLMYAVAGLEAFRLNHADTTQDVEDIRAFNLGTLPAATPHNASITGNLSVGGPGTFGGTVTAGPGGFVGNGAGITGLTGATGGVANTGSTTIGADTDANGTGVIDFQTGLVTRARVRNSGETELFNPLILPAYAFGSLPSGVTGALARLTDKERGFALYQAGAWLSVSGGVYNVRNFGAKGDGTTDDTVAIQAAIDQCEADGGGTVYFPPGTYKVTGLTVGANHVRLQGCGWASRIAMSSATGDTLVFDNGLSGDSLSSYLYGCGVENLRFEPLVTRTSGREIYAPHTDVLYLERLTFRNVYECIQLGRATDRNVITFLTNVRADTYTKFLTAVNSLDLWVTGASLDANNNAATSFILDGGTEGIHITSVDAVNSQHTSGTPSGYGMRIKNVSGVGTPPRWIFLTGVHLDAHMTGLLVEDGYGIHVKNFWASNRPGKGVEILGNASDVEIDGFNIVSNGDSGILVGAGKGHSFKNGYLVENGVSGVADAIAIGSTTTGVVIDNVKIFNGAWTGGLPTGPGQQYGIKAYAGATNFFIVNSTVGQAGRVNDAGGVLIEAGCDYFKVDNIIARGYSGTGLTNNAGTGATKVIGTVFT